MNSIQDISKIELKKIIMNTDIFFDNCDYKKNDISNILGQCNFDDNSYYTPNRKIIIHHIISKILTKRIINNDEKNIIFNIINLLSGKKDTITYTTFIYIIDKIFLYDDILINENKKDILNKLSANTIIQNYIKLYTIILDKSFNNNNTQSISNGNSSQSISNGNSSQSISNANNTQSISTKKSIHTPSSTTTKQEIMGQNTTINKLQNPTLKYSTSYKLNKSV
jgi:hypothetical protein